MNSQTHLLKKGIAVFLTALMLLSVAPLAAMSGVLPKLDLGFDFAPAAHAEDEGVIASGACGADGSDVLWSLDSDGTLTISGSGAINDFTTLLFSVRSPWYSYRTQIFSVVVNEGIASLGNYAFAGLASVESVSLPETLQSIGNSAFAGCSELKTIVVPDSVTEIGTKALGYSSTFSLTSDKVSSFVLYGLATGPAKLYAQENDVEFYCSHRLVDENDCEITGEVSATCIETGAINYRCVICNETWFNSTPLIEHTYNEGVVNETESNDAEIVTDYTCTVCGFVNSVTTEIPIDESFMLSGYCGDTSNGGDGKNVKWRLNQETGVLTLNGTGKMGSAPNRADNRIRKIVICRGITEIAANAFSHCDNLVDVVLPESLEVIHAQAFEGNQKLQTITAQGVKRIEYKAFYNCLALSSFDFSNTVTVLDYAFCGTGIVSCAFQKIEQIGLYAFSNCKSLIEVEISSSIKTIGDHAFYSDINLDKLIIHGGLKEIKGWTFYGCKLSELSLPESIIIIRSYAFNGCLTENFVIPDSCEIIESGAINSSKFHTIYIGSGLSSFGKTSGLDELESIEVSSQNESFVSFEGALYFRDYSNIVLCPVRDVLNLPDALGMIEYNFMDGFPFLKSVVASDDSQNYYTEDGILYSKDRDKLIGCPKAHVKNPTIIDGIRVICPRAFANENAIFWENLILPDSVEIIGEEAFTGCAFKTLHLPDNLKYIGKRAFYLCTWLASIDLPEGLETISVEAFKQTSIAGNVIIPDSCIAVDSDAFTSTRMRYMYIGAGLQRLGRQKDTALTEIEVSERNESFASYDGVLYPKDYNHIVLMPNKSSIELPALFPWKEDVQGVTNFLLEYGFIETVSVAENSEVYSSKDGLLYSKDGRRLVLCPCGRKGEVHVADGTEIVSEHAFTHCREITYIYLPDSLKTLDGIFNCGKLKHVFMNSGLKCIKCPFHFCPSLEELLVPESVDQFDYLSVSLSGLKRIVYPLSIQHTEFSYYGSGNTNLTSAESFVFNNKYTTIHNYGLVTPTKENATITGYCGSPAHEMAIKRLFNWNSLGHTWLNWYVAEPATFEHDGLEKRDCAYCGESEERVIPKLERETFTATFVADGRVVASVDFQKGATAIDEPAVPARDRYTGKWEDYSLNDEDLTINAVYTLIKSDDVQEIETESTVEHYTEKDNVLFRVKATSAARIVKSIVSQSIPLDIVLVVDQSGSMNDTLGGTNKKVDALKDAANSFIASVAENARLTGANHRIGIVGFGLAGSYSGYQMNENTELLTGANGVVNYSDVTPADYASALLPVLNGDATNAALTDAVAAIEARGATAADLGLEMAKGVFANTDSTGRDRIVVFMTDGEPTYTNGFQTQVANNAVYNSYLLKNAYEALVYSVGIFGTSESENRKIKSFMNAVSSNYPDAKTYTSLGTAASDVFSITAGNTDALNDVFRTITTESLSHTAPFDNVTLIKTLSPYVTLTAPQEETLRINVIRQYGISNDQITITRDDQGGTQIRIDGLTPYEVTDDEGNVSYEVAIEFFASLNENAAAADTYAVDTDDSGIMLGDNAIGYEATFNTNELALSDQKTRYIFPINSEIYEIAEGSTVAAAVPETDFAADWQFSGWDTSGASNENGTIIDATLVKAPRTVTWHTADGDIQQIYTEGQFMTPPEVADRADGSKFLSWDKSLPTVMLDQDLEFTAVYGPHIHRYTSELTTKATCTEDGLLTYTCMCGDIYTEPIAASGHNYEAITATGDSDPSRCTFVCTNCGNRYEYALNYKVEERTYYGSRTLYEFALTDDNLTTGMQPDGSIDVRVPLNEFQSTATRVTVKRCVNGVWETVPAQIEDGFLVITANHFTPYEVQFVFSCNETGNHSWGEGVVTKEATCTETGVMTYTCETCEGTTTETINKKDHTLGTWIVDKAATCQETGSKHQECAVCHSTIATETIEKNASNHASYGTTLKNKVDAKCTTKGYTGDTVCDGCGAVLARGSETKALGHTAPNSKGDCDRCGAHLKDPDSGSSTPANACKYCGEKHTGPFGWLVKFFHSILALFGLRK